MKQHRPTQGLNCCLTDQRGSKQIKDDQSRSWSWHHWSKSSVEVNHRSLKNSQKQEKKEENGSQQRGEKNALRGKRSKQQTPAAANQSWLLAPTCRRSPAHHPPAAPEQQVRWRREEKERNLRAWAGTWAGRLGRGRCWGETLLLLRAESQIYQEELIQTEQTPNINSELRGGSVCVCVIFPC